MLWLVVTTLIQPLVSLPAWRRTHHPFSAAGSICAAIALRPWRGVLALDFKDGPEAYRGIVCGACGANTGPPTGPVGGVNTGLEAAGGGFFMRISINRTVPAMSGLPGF